MVSRLHHLRSPTLPHSLPQTLDPQSPQSNPIHSSLSGTTIRILSRRLVRFDSSGKMQSHAGHQKVGSC